MVIVCHNIRSAFNIGSIFRTADGAGVEKIILGGYSAHPPHPKIDKVALGAQNIIFYERIWHTWRAIEDLKQKGYYIIALEKNKSAKNIFSAKIKKPFALVVGNEINGLSKKIINHCDETLFIPMSGQKESLNVSVAFGIAIYTLANKQTGNK